MDVIKRMLLGGAALGGGTALVASLANYLSKLKEDDSSKDDDTLYVRRAPAEGVKEASMGGALALAGGALSTMGTYTLISKLYHALLKNQAQSELDKAQQVYLEAQGFTPVKNKSTEQEKKADFRGFSTGELLASLPVALPLLLALGSGVGAYKLLDKNFPKTTAKPKAPKRIEIVDDPEEEDVYGSEKAASFMDDDCLEFMIQQSLSNPAPVSDVNNLVHAIAGGDLPEFKKAASAVGFFNALNMVKGAAAREVDPLDKQLAVTYLSKSAEFKNQMAVLVAGEHAERFPVHYKQASALPEPVKDVLYKVACLLGCAIRAERAQELGVTMPEGETTMTKAAFLDTMTDAAASAVLGDLLSGKKKDLMVPTAKEDESADVTETSGEETGIEDPDSPSRQSVASKIKYISSAKSTKGFLDKLGGDEIDEVLLVNK